MPPRTPSKRSLAREAQRLRQRPGWNPDQHVRRSREGFLREGIERQRVATAFDASDSCPDCEAARREQDDPTALCEKHLRQAMGL